MHMPVCSDSEVEQAFARYIASQWNKLDRPHRYTDRKRCDKKIEFVSLEQAFHQYYFNGKSRTETEQLLDDFSKRLQQVLGNPSTIDRCSHKLHHVCLDILVWGGVERAAQDWLTCQCDAGTLSTTINAAVNELCDDKTAPSKQPASVFQDGDTGTPMDAGMTKICALAKPNMLAIYDGRVGAGLGYLTVQFLRTAGKQYLEKSLPPALTWAWGAGRRSGTARQNRDPTRGQLEFASLRPGSPLERQRHATYMWRASRVLRLALQDIGASGATSVKLSNLEMAVFMVGYDVTDLPHE